MEIRGKQNLAFADFTRAIQCLPDVTVARSENRPLLQAQASKARRLP